MVLGKDCDAYPALTKYSWSQFKKYGRYGKATVAFFINQLIVVRNNLIHWRYWIQLIHVDTYLSLQKYDIFILKARVLNRKNLGPNQRTRYLIFV